MPTSNGSIEIKRGGEKNITINHVCGGGDCGSGGNSDSNSDGDGVGDGGGKGRRRQNDDEGIESDGGSGGGGGADGRFGGTATAMVAAGTVTVDS